MNAFVDGEWQTDLDPSSGEDGSFERETTAFRDWVGTPSLPPDTAGGRSGQDGSDSAGDGVDHYPAEAGRYHLYISYACPWAHRTLTARALKGLEDAISVSVVDPFRAEDGWQFTPEKEGCTADPIMDADYLRELYVAADPDVTGRVSVPVLWDTQEGTIVNNESVEVLRMLDVAFDEFATRDVDLYPQGYREEIDRIIDAIYEPINNGVYRAGFANTQEAYDEAVDDLFSALDHWDTVLGEQRYLAGDRLTEADVCMFTTLVRFDHVYHTHFMCNREMVHEYENLWPYLRDLYQLPGVAETVNLDHIKEHYYRTHPDVNPKRIVAPGPDLDFTAPHDRDDLPGSPPTDLLPLA